MANYDTPGVTYDSGVLYDSLSPPPQPQRSRMSKVKLNLKALNDVQMVQFATNIKTAMTGNANFTTPIPTLTAIGTAITTAQTSITTAENAQVTAKQATATKDTNVAALRTLVTQLAGYVELTAAGDPAKILSAGMAVQAGKSPAGVPAQVANLSITSGDNDGELDLQWDPVSGAKSYEIQLSPDPMSSTTWTGAGSSTKSKSVQTGLTSGTRMWARVRAVASAGPGAWSDPATKIVP